jgi:hypothetical protein
MFRVERGVDGWKKGPKGDLYFQISLLLFRDHSKINFKSFYHSINTGAGSLKAMDKGELAPSFGN